MTADAPRAAAPRLHRAATRLRLGRVARPRRATTCATPARPARSPAPAASGASATSSRSTSSAPSTTPCQRNVRAGCRSSSLPRTSRSSRPNAARRRRSRCSSTCPTRWSCAAPGARRRPPRWPCTRWSATRYPQDAIEIIGFSDYARVMSPGALVDHDWDRVQGTNLQHGLMLARRHLDKHRGSRAGHPGDHRRRADRAPGRRRVRRLRLAADARDDRRHAGRGRAVHPPRRDDQRVHARRRPAAGGVHARGRAGATAGGCSCPKPGALGEYVVADYLRARRGRRRAAG